MDCLAVDRLHLFTGQAYSNSTAADLYSGGVRFESRPRYRQYWWNISWFSSVTPRKCQIRTLTRDNYRVLPRSLRSSIVQSRIIDVVVKQTTNHISATWNISGGGLRKQYMYFFRSRPVTGIAQYFVCCRFNPWLVCPLYLFSLSLFFFFLFVIAWYLWLYFSPVMMFNQMTNFHETGYITVLHFRCSWRLLPPLPLLLTAVVEVLTWRGGR
jgi:hypothetical protein